MGIAAIGILLIALGALRRTPKFDAQMSDAWKADQLRMRRDDNKCSEP